MTNVLGIACQLLPTYLLHRLCHRRSGNADLQVIGISADYDPMPICPAEAHKNTHKMSLRNDLVRDCLLKMHDTKPAASASLDVRWVAHRRRLDLSKLVLHLGSDWHETNNSTFRSKKWWQGCSEQWIPPQRKPSRDLAESPRQ